MVEWKKIENVCTVMTPPKKLKKECYQKEGLYPIIDQGQSDIVGYTDDEGSLLASDSYVLFGDHTRNVKYISGKFAQGADGLKILKCDCFLNPKYFYYTFSNSSIPTRGYSRHWSIAKEIEIPIPPLSEQSRIVGILDTFTESIENLKKQITERKKQYEHYRDQLLDLEGKPGVEMMSMGELFTFKNGLNKGKEFFGSGKPIIMFSNVFNSRYLKSSMITNRVDITEKEMERIDAKFGDVFFTRTSETREDVGYSSVLLEDIGECTFAGFLIRARPLTDILIPSYCKYCFSSPNIRCAIIGNSSFTTRASLTGSGLGKIDLPIPPLSQQSRIVTILDTFEASIANLEQQLSLRQKQYEYYRNMLLTFDE